MLLWFLGTPVDTCGCHSCDNEWSQVTHELDPDGGLERSVRAMITCPDCGNKRCPRATHHEHQCTGSNAPGQHGSVYGDYLIDKSWVKDDGEDEHTGDSSAQSPSAGVNHV